MSRHEGMRVLRSGLSGVFEEIGGWVRSLFSDFEEVVFKVFRKLDNIGECIEFRGRQSDISFDVVRDILAVYLNLQERGEIVVYDLERYYLNVVVAKCLRFVLGNGVYEEYVVKVRDLEDRDRDKELKQSVLKIAEKSLRRRGEVVRVLDALWLLVKRGEVDKRYLYPMEWIRTREYRERDEGVGVGSVLDKVGEILRWGIIGMVVYWGVRLYNDLRR